MMWWWVHERHDTLKHPQRCSVFDPAKIFLTSKFLFFIFFPTPSIQLKLELQIGGRLLIANHLDQSLYNDWSIRIKEQQSDHIYYTLLWQVLGFAVHFTSVSKFCRNAGSKPFCWAKPRMFWLFFAQFLWARLHTELTTAGDALSLQLGLIVSNNCFFVCLFNGNQAESLDCCLTSAYLSKLFDARHVICRNQKLKKRIWIVQEMLALKTVWLLPSTATREMEFARATLE